MKWRLVHLLEEGLEELVDLRVGRETAGLASRVFQRAIDRDVELTRLAGAQLDVGRALFLEAIPHTEGLRLVASSAAIFDQHFHRPKVGAKGAANKRDFP